jgi:hypothetical protein
MGKLNSGSRPLSLVSALSAFALSAAMGAAFVMVVNKTHDLFSSATFADGVPNVAAPFGWQEQTVVGTWEGKWHDVPSVTVTIGRQGDQLTGTVIFQAVLKSRSGPKPTGAPVSIPLKDARFDGKTLRFKVDDNRAARDWRESGMEMTLTSANRAELRLAHEQSSGMDAWEFEEVVMTKTA